MSFAGAPQPSTLTELRRGIGGSLYSWSDCVDHYGPSHGSRYWLATEPLLHDGTATTLLREPQQVLANLAQAPHVPSAVAWPEQANLPPGFDG